jgi:hypothetical protein
VRGLRARRRREVSLAARVGGMAARQRGREEWARRSREAALLERALRLGPSSSQAAAKSSEGGKEWDDGGDEQWQGQVAGAHSAHLLRASAALEHAGAGGAVSPWPELIEETQAEDTDDPPGGTARPRQSERVSESGLPREAAADEEKDEWEEEDEEEEEEDALFLAAAMNSGTHGTSGGADGGGGTTAATAAIGFTIRQLEVRAAGWDIYWVAVAGCLRTPRLNAPALLRRSPVVGGARAAGGRAEPLAGAGPRQQQHAPVAAAASDA